MNEIPLFLFGVFITLLVAVGVVLAVLEFRQANMPQKPHETSETTLHSSAPPSSV